MFFRVCGIAVTLGIVGYMFSMVLKAEKAVEKNPAVVEQKKALRDAGVPVDDKQKLQRHLIEQAREIEASQNAQ
jgi:hypothetical protein